MAVHQIRTSEEFERLLEQSFENPVLLFKHSTQCPTSADAFDEFEAFMKSSPQIHAGLILVIEDRAQSNDAARRLGIRHESPQAIVIDAGRAVWNASHFAISRRSIEDALTPIAKSRT